MKNRKQRQARNSGTADKNQAIPRILAWTDRHFRFLALGVLAIGVALRIGLLVEFPHFPYSTSYLGKNLDMEFFDHWSDRIVAGDVLTDTILHPYHDWHETVARSSGAQDREQGIALWSKWYGGKTYHQDPLYAWFIAAVKAMFGKSLLPVFIAQMLLGLLSIWLVLVLGRHYAGALAGLTGGLLFALYGQSLFYDVILLRTSLQTVTLLGMIWTTEQLLKGPRLAWLMGLLGGLGFLLSSTFLVAWLPLVARWLWIRRADIRRAWPAAAVFAACLTLLVARNVAVGAPVLSSSAVGPVTYALSNFPGYYPQFGFAHYPEVGRILDKADGSLFRTILDSIRLFPSFWDWVALQWQKFAAIFHWFEIPNNVNGYLAIAFSPALRIAFVPYSLIAGLGLWGFLASIRRKEAIPLAIALASQVIIMTAFYVLARFRVPMTAILAVYAGIGVSELFRIGGRSLSRALLWTVVPLALWALVSRPNAHTPLKYDRNEYGLVTQYYFLSRLTDCREASDWPECIAVLEQILSTVPRHMRDLPAGARFKDQPSRDLVNYYGNICLDLSGLYDIRGDQARADAYRARAAAYQQAGS